MKKLIVTILTIVILTMCLAGCKTNKAVAYISCITDSSNSEYSLESESDYWMQQYFEKEDMFSKEYEIQGQLYTGNYKHSIIEKADSFETDIYVTETGVEFGFRCDTGKITYLNLMNLEFFDTEPYLDDVVDSQQKAAEIAKKIASDYLDNIDDYIQINHNPTTRYKEKDGKTYEITYFQISFAKKINGCLSSDYMTIKITSKGNLASFKVGDLGAFDDAKMDFEIEKVNESVENKIKSSYESKNINVQKTTIDDQKIVLNPDGKIGILSKTVVEVGYDKDNTYQAGVEVFTFIE